MLAYREQDNKLNVQLKFHAHCSFVSNCGRMKKKPADNESWSNFLHISCVNGITWYSNFVNETKFLQMDWQSYLHHCESNGIIEWIQQIELCFVNITWNLILTLSNTIVLLISLSAVIVDSFSGLIADYHVWQWIELFPTVSRIGEINSLSLLHWAFSFHFHCSIVMKY